MRKSYDVIIAGCGAAGLYAALSIDPDMSVLVLSKNSLDLCNSALAQGGIAAVLDREHDSEKLHMADTLVAGGFKNDIDALSVLVGEGPADVLNLIKMGVDFDTDANGKLNMTLEGGHTKRRIMHHKDTSGYEIVIKLIACAQKRKNIELADNAAILKLEKGSNGFTAGVLTKDGFETVGASYCILATGGVGKVYKYSTNSKIATGDGIALAYRLGARIKDLSLIQFHPTAFAAEDVGERFLISESVRGEGAYLLNCDGRRFMKDYDSRGELAPRDVVSKCIYKESKKTGSDLFYLDISYKDADYLKNRFPAIYKKCLEHGIDITKDKIPVYPCQHYLMGGIDVDTWARTTVDGLYAVGECSHTGVHGNNRLASNSLLEAVVFARRAAQDIMSRSRVNGKTGFIPKTELSASKGKPVPSGYKDEIREIMQSSFFIYADQKKAQAGLVRISEILKELSGGAYTEDLDYLETQSIATVASLILKEVIEK